LYVAFEISKREWKLAMTSGFGAEVWLRTVRGGDLEAVQRAFELGRARFGLPVTARVVSCQEAGPAGFWIHRALTGLGVVSRLVDSASLEVNRRRRRAKTDRLDAKQLLRQLLRVCFGEQGVWSEVRVPTVAQEAARHASRERTALVKEQTRLTNQLRSCLATWGTSLPKRRSASWWTSVRDWAGALLPRAVQDRLARADGRLALVMAQIEALDEQQDAAISAVRDPDDPGRRLTRLKAVAPTTAAILLDEGLVWRGFRNRREIGGLLGFAPTPYNSGDSEREQGISGAGNKRLQSISVQLAWNWVRWQPASALTRWYRARFGTGKRARRIGIVALARKLLIALWRYATQGVVPDGAILKSAPAR
jgi:transposase